MDVFFEVTVAVNVVTVIVDVNVVGGVVIVVVAVIVASVVIAAGIIVMHKSLKVRFSQLRLYGNL